MGFLFPAASRATTWCCRHRLLCCVVLTVIPLPTPNMLLVHNIDNPPLRHALSRVRANDNSLTLQSLNDSYVRCSAVRAADVSAGTARVHNSHALFELLQPVHNLTTLLGVNISGVYGGALPADGARCWTAVRYDGLINTMCTTHDYSTPAACCRNVCTCEYTRTHSHTHTHTHTHHVYPLLPPTTQDPQPD